MFTYFVKTKTSFDEAIRILKNKADSNFIIVKPELCFSPKFLRYTLFLAYKSFQDDTATAKTIELEWLSKIAGTTNVTSALTYCLPPKAKGTLVGIASAKQLSKENLESIGETAKTSQKSLEKKAAALIQVKPAALKNYSLEELAIEKAAVAAL